MEKNTAINKENKDAIRKLIESHILKEEGLHEYDKLDVAAFLNQLKVPWKWIETYNK